MKILFDKNLKAKVTIDEHNNVYTIRHNQKHWLSQEKTPLRVAIDYLKNLSEIYKIPQNQLESLSQKIVFNQPKDQGVEYRLSEEKASFDSHTIGFYQTYKNIPVWRAGLKVLIKNAPYRVINSVNTSHREIDAKLPSKKILKQYQEVFSKADRVRNAEESEANQEKGESELSSFIGDLLETEKGEQKKGRQTPPKFIRGRFFIYKYDSEKRFEHPEKGSIHEQGPEPAISLAPVDKKIKEGEHYVVAEITFSMSTPQFHDLTWRILVELETNSILYIRALGDGVDGFAYLHDPISATGDDSITSDQDNSILNPLRDTVALQNLDSPSGGTQSLSGDYANLTNVHNPNVAPPEESSGDDFEYDVRTNHFAAVSAYFHVNRVFVVIESLGFSIPTYFRNTNFPIRVDHRGYGGLIGAHCVSDGMGGISHTCYGLLDHTDTTNPLGRACDPRVHWHELCGHGILYEHVGSANFGFSHSVGDVLAGIFFDPDSQAPGDQRYEYVPWHPTLRRRFDRDISNGWAWGGSRDNAGYGSEEIIATTLFRVYQAIGGDSPNEGRRKFASKMMIYLILRAVQNLTPATNPEYARDFASELMSADQLNWTTEGVFGGAYNKVIRWSFEKQGEYQDPLLERSDPGYGSNTDSGEPPTVDVYIDDGRHGEYEYLRRFWKSTTIWNRHVPDEVDSHQPPVIGETNYAYVKVKNRGTQTANNVVVKGFNRRPSTGLIWPDDFKPMDTPEIDAGSIAGNNSEEKIVGPFEWIPETEGIGHDCMLMIVSADDDPSNIDNFTLGEIIPHWRLVPNDNNIAQRNVNPVPGGGGSEALIAGLSGFPFWVRNPNITDSRITIELKLPAVLEKKGWKIKLQGIPGNQFTLASGAQRKMVIEMIKGKDFTLGEIDAVSDRDIEISTLADNNLVGGMTYRIDPKMRKPANICKPKCEIEASKLLDCLNIKGQKVKDVKIKSISVDIEIDNDFDRIC